MTFEIELIDAAGMSMIQADLRRQSKYKNVLLENFLWDRRDQRWAIDRKRHRYLHPILQAGPPSECSFHFLMDGVSYELVIPNGICLPQHIAFIYRHHHAVGRATMVNVLPAMQEAFDVFGLHGSGPDDEGWPGFNRVELVLPSEIHHTT